MSAHPRAPRVTRMLAAPRRPAAGADRTSASRACAARAVRAVLPFLDPALAGADARTRLAQATEAVALTSGAGFECHLGDPDRVDFAIRFQGDEAPLATALGFPGGLAADFGIVWLELDLPRGEPPRRGWFFGPGNAPCAASSRPSATQWIDAVEAFVTSPRLRGEVDRASARSGEGAFPHALPVESAPHLDPLPASGERERAADVCVRYSQARRTLAACLEAIPPGAWPGYLGILPARGAGLVRVTVTGLPLEQIGAFLAAIGGGSPQLPFLPELLAEAPPVRIVLHLDVEHFPEKWAPVFRKKMRQPSNPARFFTAAHAISWSPQTKSALAGAIRPDVGIELSPNEPSDWPRLLRAVLPIARMREDLALPILAWPGAASADLGWGDAAPARIVRRINHVKLVGRPGAPPRAKVYLYYGLLEHFPAKRAAVRRRKCDPS